MFTGLVQGVASIVAVQPLAADGGLRLTVDAAAVPEFAAAVGDSIALNGACMTATTVDGARFTVDVSRESLSKTAGLAEPGEVNLETSLRLGDRIGGHLVSGHVDGVGCVESMTPVGESWTLVIRAPRALARFLAVKGSVAVDGVSLTINEVVDHADGCDFTLNIIPHTHAVTTLRRLRGGEQVNLEIDTVARYVERMLAAGRD
jgi:riboflavin synthase